MDNSIKNPFIDQMNTENVVNENNISMSDDELKAKEERRKNSLNNLKTFKPFSELTPEEQEEQRLKSIKGAKARCEVYRQKKTMKQSAQALLDATISREYAEKVLGENSDVSGIETMQDLLIAKMMREILENGNAKAFELIRDTSGNKPVSTAALDIKADIVTAADRALIDKVADRLGVDITDDDNDENR